MDFSSYNPHERYRRRAARRTTSMLIFLFIFLAICGVGYWAGTIHAQQRIYILQQEKGSLADENKKMQNEMTQLRAEAQTANVRLEQLRASYEEILPEGPMRDLVTLLKQQIDKGVDVKRLESVILLARPPQNCTDPESKRFVVTTPVYKGPGSTATISSGIAVFGEGVAARNSTGHKEAWFDPRQPVSITFKVKGRETKVKKGILPIYHSTVSDGKEYRFTVSASAKSFAKVTFDHCDYP